MSTPWGALHIILNPTAGRGAAAREWPIVRSILDASRAPYTVAVTNGKDHATALAIKTVSDGGRFVVAIGGDGTIHEVVNGLMSEEGPRASGIVLGVVPAGSGCDFSRTFGIPRDPAAAARSLLGENLWGAIDLGRVRCVDQAGEKQLRWFVNVAEAGLGADVVQSAGKMPRWLGSKVYKIAALREIARHEPFHASISMRGRKARGSRVDAPLDGIEFEGEASLIVVANCQFFGGGMHVAPRAIPSDGLLDVQIATGSKVDAMKVMQRISKGTHVPNQKILEYLATEAVIDGPVPIMIEADGEILGTTPATFDLYRDALKLKI